MSSYREITIGELLKETVSRYGKEEALVAPETGLRQNYQEFYNTCKDIAKGLMAMGIRKGDNVSLWATNIPEWAQLQFALGMAGGVLVTVNTSYKTRELEYILKQSDSTTLFLIEEFKDTSYYETTRGIVPELEESEPGKISSSSLPYLKNIVYIGNRGETPGMFKFKDVVEMGKTVTDEELEQRQKTLHTHDVINMQYTSGTTGFPKGVMLTHYNIINNARLVGEVAGMTHKDRLLIQVPLFHCFGCVISSLNCVYFGATMVLLDHFNPLKALDIINREKCTAVNGVPTMFISILNHQDFDKYDMSSLRTGVMAGAPCPAEVMNQVINRMHCPEIVIAYGLTECSPVITMTRRNDPVDVRVSTIGSLLDGIEGRIADTATGKELPLNTQGEIVTRGGCVMKGYYKMQEATDKAIDKQGWLHTGDLGTVDENGNFRVTGRMKDMIIRGGENIYPREIEEFLYTNPKVRGVQVVGVPDEKYGEEILAAIQLKKGVTSSVEDIQEFCKGKIARHKIPHYVVFVESFPMTASGKVQKYKLRDMFAGKLKS
ncbi:AMP-binding protein [candidate division WOR-3 bacterium JGI_Cruoil_03_51_56]|uniref:AMP-binding protein n=1 Tax=candidate division WOR-3 bacterium JGI_Cruoil_03_51_56 TaxID=1973747 RepID=A0A235BRK7_UNCW3|nr:MAG: AMP-binding protein [candidate division WOR-3 bacterium JGI_Cruoil_03_51_56]